jgi:hypothetical protein
VPPLEGGDKFPPVLSMLIQHLFDLCGPSVVVRAQVNKFVGQCGGHRRLLCSEGPLVPDQQSTSRLSRIDTTIAILAASPANQVHSSGAHDAARGRLTSRRRCMHL